MNIVLLGHYDIASLNALDRVIGLLPEHRCSVFLSGELPKNGASNSSLAKLAKVDAGLCKRFLDGEIRGAVAAQLCAPPPGTLNHPNSPHGLRMLSDLYPDLIVSIRYRRILQEAVIAMPTHGVINLHSGVLPDYRGVMATFWAMLADEREIGATLHWIVDSGIDTGPIIEIHRRPTRLGSSYLANVLGLYAAGCNMIADTVRAIAAGRDVPSVRQVAQGAYFRAPRECDVRRFEHNGLALFDGQEEAEIKTLEDPGRGSRRMQKRT